jgi:hypothetical protein
MKNAAGTCGLATPAPSACQEMFIGKLEPGEECRTSMECAAPPGGNAGCEADVDDVDRCVQMIRGRAGEDCAWTCTESSSNVVCFHDRFETSFVEGECYTNDGLYCDGVCKTQASIGEACTQSEGCQEGAYCHPELWTCETRSDAGEHCSTWDACAEGLYCPTRPSMRSRSRSACPQ